MPGAVFIGGDRVNLRTVESEDVDVLQRAYNEPDFHHGFPVQTPKNRSMVEDHIDNQVESEDDSIYLLICADQTPVGAVSLNDVHQHAAKLAYWVLPEERGEGYATEGSAYLVNHGFNGMGLHRIHAWTLDDNEASQTILKRLGFTHEGTFREHIYTRGAYHDVERYGLLTQEWDGVDAVLTD